MSLQSIIAEYFEHIDSRIRRETILKGVAPADVQAIAASEGLARLGEVDLFTAVSKLRGGLRNVENALRMAAIFAGGDKVTVQHLNAAIQDLKLHNAGGMCWHVSGLKYAFRVKFRRVLPVVNGQWPCRLLFMKPFSSGPMSLWCTREPASWLIP